MDQKPSKRPRLAAPSEGAVNREIVDLTECDDDPRLPNKNNQDPLFLDASNAVIRLFTSPEDEKLRQDFVTRQLSISSHSHLNQVMTMREMLGLDPLWKPSAKASHNPTTVEEGYSGRKSIEWFVLCNYMCNFEFLLEDYPELLSVPNKVFFIHDGSAMGTEQYRSLNPSTDFCFLNPKDEPGTPTNPLKYKLMYGTHHTKMILVGMEDRLRVIVYTCNMLGDDLIWQANGAFIQDFPLKHSVASAPTALGDDFERTLMHYLESYGYHAKKSWSLGAPSRTLVEQIAQYDFSNAKGILIPSIPGYHPIVPEEEQRPENGRPTKPLVGYLKLKDAIQTHAATHQSSQKRSTRYGPVVCQFSSIGSLSEKWIRDFGTSLSAAPVPKGKQELVDMVKVVWPTIEEMEATHAGLGGGASLPGTTNNLKRKFLMPLFCKWSPRASSNNPIHQAKSVPHIKTFFQLRHTKEQGEKQEEKSFAWFCIGSQNLSKAAWGEIINGKYGKCHRVNAWEMAVFVCPTIFGKGQRLVPFTGKEGPDDTAIPLPYDCIPQRYSRLNDEPWNVEEGNRRMTSAMMGGGGGGGGGSTGGMLESVLGALMDGMF